MRKLFRFTAVTYVECCIDPRVSRAGACGTRSNDKPDTDINYKRSVHGLTARFQLTPVRSARRGLLLLSRLIVPAFARVAQDGGRRLLLGRQLGPVFGARRRLFFLT